jgi:hypothetical protein
MATTNTSPFTIQELLRRVRGIHTTNILFTLFTSIESLLSEPNSPFRINIPRAEKLIKRKEIRDSTFSYLLLQLNKSLAFPAMADKRTYLYYFHSHYAGLKFMAPRSS